MSTAPPKVAQPNEKAVSDFLPHITVDDLDQAGEWSLAAIGRHIKHARTHVFHVTQEAFAAKIGISHVSLRKMEKGDPGISAGTYFRALALMRRTKTIALAADYFASDTLAHRGPPAAGLMATVGLVAPAGAPAQVSTAKTAPAESNTTDDLGVILNRFTSGQATLARPR